MVREQLISTLVAGKDILDIGSIGQSDEYSLWSFYQSCGVKSLAGIDLPEAKVTAATEFGLRRMNNDGRVVLGNMETYDFERQFDVIIAGDVIEHVENQGLFLRNIHRHLREGGNLVLTTPNAKWLTVLFKPNRTHTFWHDRYTLERILHLTGFKIEYFRYYHGNKPRYSFVLMPLLLRQSMYVVCGKS